MAVAWHEGPSLCVLCRRLQATLFVCLLACLFNRAQKGKADSTLSTSQPVPQASTTRALFCLTSEVERDPVYSEGYGRRRLTTGEPWLRLRAISCLEESKTGVDRTWKRFGESQQALN